MGRIIHLLKPQTSGASISPFSRRNLSIGKGTNKYQYTNAQIEEYKKITDVLNKKDILVISRINDRFLAEIVCKKLKNNIQDIKSDMKKKQLKTKDYIYFMGFEKEYLRFLKEEIDEYKKNKDKG